MKIDTEQVGQFNRRYGIRLDDGSRIEAVLYRGDTLCISTQVGCAVRCPFCASGANGLGRHLSIDELRGQVELVRGSHPIERITLSGIGEPLHNHNNTTEFLSWARSQGLKTSLTTSGGPTKRLREWLRLPHNGLTISVHAGSEPTRAQLVPQAPTLEELFAVLRQELPSLTRKRRKKTALAYLLMRDQNDDASELDAFAARVLALKQREPALPVHLYAYNPVATSATQPVTREQYEAAYAHLSGLGLRVRMSSKARIEANGGCGTLVAIQSSSRNA